MSAADSKKRKQVNPLAKEPPKKPRTSEAVPRPTLITPHQPIITTLTHKHNVLPLSIISSTQIQTRVTSATQHLLDHPPNGIVLLYARPPEVCKLITVVEQCKRILKGEGRSWWQYNEMFWMERVEKKKKEMKADVVEKTVLEGVGDDDDADEDEDYFETMESRFEKAVKPPSSPSVVKSLRIFLSLDTVQELKTREGITVQMSEVKSS